MSRAVIGVLLLVAVGVWQPGMRLPAGLLAAGWILASHAHSRRLRRRIAELEQAQPAVAPDLRTLEARLAALEGRDRAGEAEARARAVVAAVVAAAGGSVTVPPEIVRSVEAAAPPIRTWRREDGSVVVEVG